MQLLFALLGHRPDLTAWDGRPFSVASGERPGPGDWRDVFERVLGREPPGPPLPDGPFRRAATAILGYRVFPARLVSGVIRREPVRPGDTVGIRFHVLPGVDLFFAARVTEAFDEPTPTGHRAGFTYRTLVGHPELGEETFSAEKDATTGIVRAVMASWSRPGVPLARLGKPVARALQKSANTAALANLARVAAGRCRP